MRDMDSSQRDGRGETERMVERIDPDARPEVPGIGLVRSGQMGIGTRQLPEGRERWRSSAVGQGKTLLAQGAIEDRYRPFGTLSAFALYPALTCRAIECRPFGALTS